MSISDPRKISGMSPALPLEGDELLEVLQKGVNRRMEARELQGPQGPEGKGVYELAVANGFEGSRSEWLEELKGRDGKDGRPGERGPEGLSAYEVAVAEGFDGTVSEWLIKIRGKSAFQHALDKGFEGTLDDWLDDLKGENGQDGKQGKRGPRGYDNYELAVEEGEERTREEWLADQQGRRGADGPQGPEGKSAYEIAQADGFEGSLDDWFESMRGSTGLSAYEIAVEDGFVGSRTRWLEKLKGSDGDRGPRGYEGRRGPEGRSAYQLAQDDGFDGSLREWLESLKGDKGDKGDEGPRGRPGKDGVNGTDGSDGLSAYELAVEKGFEGTIDDWLSSQAGSTLKIHHDQTTSTITELAFTGATVTVEGEKATVAVEVPEGGGSSTPVAPQRVKFDLTSNGYTGKANVVALGTSDQLAEIKATVVGGSKVKFYDVPADVNIQSITVAYNSGFNDKTDFTIEYPDPYGDTDETDMVIPVLFQYSQANPSVMQPPLKQNYRNNDGVVTLTKSGLASGDAWRWKCVLI